MKTYLFEGLVTALSSISHNGGEQNSTISQLRREKIVQPDGTVEDIPVISGNAIRGVLRDVGMAHMLRMLGYGIQENEGGKKLSLPAFYFLFSGGSLTSTGSTSLDIEYFRRLRRLIPLIGVFGGAIGNTIMPGKLKLGKLIPICLETIHILPEKFRVECSSVWEYCQQEMYTRKDDEKNDLVRGVIEGETLKLLGSGEISKKEITSSGPQQMKYYVETFSAGTRFYWKIVLEDVTDLEFEAFLVTLIEFSKFAKVGGKSNIGLGEIAVKFDRWVEIDSRAYIEERELGFKLGEMYLEHLRKNKNEIQEELERIR